MADLKNIGDSIGAQFRGLSGLHPGQWPLIPRVMCGLGVIVVVVALGWFGYVSGQLDELNSGQQDEAKLMDDYKLKIQQAVNLDGLRKQKEQVNEYVATLEKQLPSKAEMDALLSDINQSALGRGMQFEVFRPGLVVVRDYYAELPISIKLTGGYHDIAAFASDIASLPRIVTLTDLNLVATKDGTLSLESVAKTYRYLDADEVAAQRKSAADKKKGGKK